MLRDVPVQAAVVGRGALGDVYARNSECLLGDLGWAARGKGNAEVAGNEHEFVV